MWQGVMDFAFFILLNAVLLIRVEDLFPSIAGLRLYLIVICVCLLTTGTRIIQLLQPSNLAQRPVTVCVLGLWVAGIVSHLAHGQFGLAMDFAGEFGKVILYYLILLSVLNTPRRLHTFLGWLVGIVIVLTSLALLQYHEYIDVESLRTLERRDYEEDGDFNVVNQLRGPGIYNDPNDLCLILVTGSICSFYRITCASEKVTKFVWLLPIGLFCYALTLTKSRGGLLGLLAAAMTWSYSRYGWRKTLAISVISLPALFAMGTGRQTDISFGKEDTLNARVQLWSDGWVEMMSNPIIGIGPNEYTENVGQPAHNTFIHVYVEMGIIGGSLFLNGFVFVILALGKVHTRSKVTIATLSITVLAIVMGYIGGIFSLSRSYVTPTYMIIGLADCYLRLSTPYPPSWQRIDGTLVVKGAIIGIAGLVALKILTKILLATGS